MSKSPTAQQSAPFIVLTYNEHDKLDAAAVFYAAPGEAWHEAVSRSLQSQSSKFQVFALQHDASGSLTFSRVEKPRK